MELDSSMFPLIGLAGSLGSKLVNWSLPLLIIVSAGVVIQIARKGDTRLKTPPHAVFVIAHREERRSSKQEFTPLGERKANALVISNTDDTSGIAQVH